MAVQRDWFEKDYYAVLGVSPTATQKEVKAAHRRLAKKHHPDATGGDDTRYKEISAAYEVLGDAAKRAEYDDARRLGPLAGGMGGGFPGGGSFRVDDISDLLGGLFNRGRARTGGPRRGADLEAELHLSFDEAVAGVTTEVHVTSDAPCSVCSGTGAAPGTSPVICAECGGRGVRDDNQGLFSFSQPCRGCGGTGMRVETPCPTCRGAGVERRPRKVKVRVPRGVAEGQRIRLKGRGGVGHGNGPPGDLFVTVHVKAHPLFGRKGHDLNVTIPVTFAEAALGASVEVPTLDGPLTLKLKPGTQSGTAVRVRSRGVPKPNGGSGDLFVTWKVAVPTELSDAERQAIEALAAVSTESPRASVEGASSARP